MATATLEQHLSERVFKHEWVIKDWFNVQCNEALIEKSNTKVQCQVEDEMYAEFLVGMNIFPTGPSKYIRFHWKLITKHYDLDSAEVNLVIEALKGNSTSFVTYKSQANAEIGRTVAVENNLWTLSPNWIPDNVKQYTNSAGSLVIKLQLTLTNVFLFTEKEEEFRETCKQECSQNLAAILDDKLSSDVKIVTKDKIGLLAHKLILRARCPFFTSMFGSDFLESSTGVVNVDDISAKTMEILLNYWYSGELLPSWKDEAIVVEFAYAAGKYQMANILKMLDDFLGRNTKASDVDVGLLKMVHNLSLKNAEERILKRIILKISQATNGAEILDMFSLGGDNLEEEKLSASEMLIAYNDALSEQIDIDVCSRHVKLLALACKLGLKNVETKLLERVIFTVNKIGTADELFALFDIQNKTQDENSNSGMLLVRDTSK